MPIPIGINATPITKKVGRTVPAVNIGCHAGKRCCLNALSKHEKRVTIANGNIGFIKTTPEFYQD